MKNSCLIFCAALLLASSVVLWGSPHEPPASPDPIYNIDTKWPDTRFVIVKVVRINPTNVLMIIQIAVGSKADNPTFIGYEEKLPVDATKNSPAPMANKSHKAFSYRAFSLLDATVVDEADKTQYGAVAPSAGRPSYGPSVITTTMAPGNWLQLSVQFNLPTPPPNPDGTLPIQKITVTLPQAKDSVKNVIVPPAQKT